MAGQGLVIRVRVEGAQATLAAFRLLPAAASKSLRERTQELSRTLAGKIATAGRADSGQSALVAATVKAGGGVVPTITAGGTARVGRNRAPAYKVLFGSEFGATRLPQFRPHLGAGSYWFFTTAENSPEIGRAWSKVADDIIEAFTRG